MSLVNKSFKDNQTGEIIRIIDSYQNIAITDSKEKIDANRLMDNRFYTEYIDPKSFFQNESTYNVFAEKIKNVDLSRIPVDNEMSGDVINIPSDNGFNPATNESAVVMYDPEDEKAELMRKYGATDTGALNKQNQAFAKLLGEDGGDVIQVDADRPQRPQPQTQPVIQPQPVQTEVVQRVNFEDPIITMFKNAKRNVDFSVDLKVDGKIPRIDFIEMMEDSYEISIIEFLADEFTNELLNNPSKLKMKVIEEIKKKVYPQLKTDSVVINEVESVKETTEFIQPKPKTSTRSRKKTNEKNETVAKINNQ
jgi:hypothetical protein